MRMTKEVNYKVCRLNKKEEFLILNTKDKTYSWTEYYEAADMFDNIELAKSILKLYNVKLTNDYKYCIVEDILEDVIILEV